MAEMAHRIEQATRTDGIHATAIGTLMLARVDPAGKVLWKADTGIERFKLAQILPDARFMAFIGTRPPVPDKVSEPILVVVDNESGVASTVSLWQ